MALINRFYVPTYCNSFSGKATKNSLALIEQMAICEDNKICKIGKVTEMNLSGLSIKQWKCDPQFGEIYIGGSQKGD